VTVVADSSPLVVLTKLACFDLLNRLFPRLYISAEVHDEVVIAGAGLPGASEVSQAEWIEVKALQNPSGLYSAQRKYGLGPPVGFIEIHARTLVGMTGLEPAASAVTGGF